MAWYALYKWFIPWRKIPYKNWIYVYKRFLYDEWFDPLSEDEKVAELNRQQKMKEKRKHEGDMALARLGMMLNAMNRITQGRICDYMGSMRFVDKISSQPSKYW